MKRGERIDGWVVLDKPSGISSAHAVTKVKHLLHPKKIGHAGTLDPLASGILPLALGEATKTVSYMMEAKKAYSFTVTFGEERDTDDSQGQVTQTSGQRPIREQVLKLLPEFIGDIMQLPPDYSALKIDGKRAYDIARAGEEVELKPRKVSIYSLEMTDFTPNAASFTCFCGKGTYIRSIARDLGRKLGCFGHITVLRRLQVGPFSEKNTLTLDELASKAAAGESCLQPVEVALETLPVHEVTTQQADRLKHGLGIEGASGTAFVQARCEGRLVAICEADSATLKPVRVFDIRS